MDFEQLITERVKQRVPVDKLCSIGVARFYVAGNCLNRAEPRDIDVFPVEKGDFDAINVNKLDLISSTRNAMTVRLGGKIVQLCKYYHNDLFTLVHSFDFAHVQIGAKVRISTTGHSVEEIQKSGAWSDAKEFESTWYTGSEYPLSSLIRTVKYAKRGHFSGNSYIWAVLNVLEQLIGRGFYGYEDFKDQLDAVDLGLLPEEIEELDTVALKNLFESLNKGERKER